MKQRVLTMILILAISLFASHIAYNIFEGARVDMTETSLYSLTEGSQDILEKMKEEGVKPIEVKLYFSYTAGKTLPKFIKNFITYKNYVHNLLKEYERASEGKIRLTVIDPVTDSDDEEDAEDYRLDGKPINNEGDKFFFGLVFETQTGSKDIIDFLWPEKQETIEYEISKKLYSLVWPTKKRIAVVSSLEPLPGEQNPYMMQMMAMQGKKPSEPWLAMQVLQETYEVATLSDVDSISHDEYDLLMVIHPKNLSEKMLWAINEWVVTGGDTMVFVDNYAIKDEPASNPQQPWAQLQYKRASQMDKLLNTWGLRQKSDTFAVDYDLAAKRPVDRSGMTYTVINDLVYDDQAVGEHANQDMPIFQGLSNIRFFTPALLETVDGVDADIKPILQTSKAGGELVIKPGFGDNGELAYTDMQNPNKLLDNYSASGEKALAYMISGRLTSAFPEGATFAKETPEPPPGMPPGMQMPPAEDAEMITKEAIAADKMAESRVLVFADVDFIADELAFQQSFFGAQAANDNYKVLLNSVDYLLGAKELMKVRSKQLIRRPFEAFDRIEDEADRQMLDQEQAIRAEIEQFQEDLRAKQGSINEKDAALFEKKLGDEIETLNAKIREGERKLRDIRKAKRGLLEDRERDIWFFNLAFMPVLICALGIMMFMRRRNKHIEARSK